MRLFKIFNSILFLALANIVQAQEITPQVGEELFIDAVKAFETKDYQTAIELFSLLAEQGEATSQHNLSLLYLKGLGSPVNYRRALRWAWLASLGGNESAPELIDDIRELIEDLPEMQAAVISMRYGIGDEILEPMSMTAIGQILNMSRDRVRTLEQKGIRSLREADSEINCYL